MNTNEQPDFEKITCGEWLELWFEVYKKPILKPYSVRNIEQIIRLHIPDGFKSLTLKTVSVFDCDRALSSVPIGRTRVYTRQVMISAFSKALKLGIISKNPASLTDPVRYQKKRGNALSLAEQEHFFHALEGKRVKWLMLFYLYSGVRRSEAVSLLWSDIDEQNGVILIRGTKTNGSFRQILLSDELKKILSEQRKQNEADFGTRFQSAHPEKVFDYSPSYVSQAFKKICSAHNLHHLRHNFITRCAESGVNITVCQQLVGHSTANTTLNIYTHIFDDFKRSEARKLVLSSNYKP